MAIHLTAKVPFNRIIKMGIIDNHTDKKKLNAVYSNLKSKYPGKEIYITNCGFFCMDKTLAPCFGMKIANKELSDNWNYGWFGINYTKITYGDPGTKPTDYLDAVTGYPVLITNGKKSPLFSHCIDNTDRGRTFLGFNKNEVILSCIQDVSGKSDFTLDEELNYMLNQNCDYAINLDGGGSSQAIFPNGQINSSRIVSNFFYIIVEPEITHEKQIQNWLNTTYKFNLVVDGSLGPASKKAIIKAMQKEIGVTADGSWGPKSKTAVKSLGLNSSNNTENKVKILQSALCMKGYWDKEINGIFDSELDNAVRKFQKAYKLTVDGFAGATTFTYLFK